VQSACSSESACIPARQSRSLHSQAGSPHGSTRRQRRKTPRSRQLAGKSASRQNPR
jgi:hypothetical protein